MKQKIWLHAMHFFSHSCHQKSERSFFYHGYQFPVCARCTGMYIGYGVGLILWLIQLHLTWWILLFLLSVMGLDWLIQYKGWRQSTNTRRCISGLGAGIACMQIMIYVLQACVF